VDSQRPGAAALVFGLEHRDIGLGQRLRAPLLLVLAEDL